MATTQPANVRPDEVGPDWMNWALRRSGVLADGAQVTSVDREPCGTGQLADSYRFTLGYDPAGAGPETVVGKFASEDPASRTFGQQSGYYRTEILFYQQLAPRLSAVALPTALHAEVADDGAEFVLVMDDLAPARVVDQLVGCTVDEAALAVRQLAALHAGSWRNDQLATMAWLQGAIASFTDITANFPATLEAFPAAFGDLVPESDLRQAAKLNAHPAEWNRLISTPLSLWHSDVRADNLLFDARGGRTPVALLDWQGVGYGYGPIDVAYFLSTSLTTEDRRSAEWDLVRLYQSELAAHGIDDYPSDRAWDDYRVLAIHPLQIGVFGAGAVRRSERGDQLWKQWIERAAQHTRDLDSFQALAAR
jgi:thiamine kinase-like enzyme